MEKANAIKPFSCRAHPDEYIRKISQDYNGASLYCVECVLTLDKIGRKNVMNIEDFLTRYLKSQSQTEDMSAKFGTVPDGIEDFLSREQEIKTALASHIEGEKVKMNQAFDQLKQACNDNIEKKRVELLKNLDDQLVLLDVNFELFAEKINFCKQGSKNVDTLESLVNQINRFEDTKDLEKFLSLLSGNIEENEGFFGMEKGELTQKMEEGLRELCNSLSKMVEEKPTTTASNPIKLEEVLAQWNSSIQKVLSDLNVEINNSIYKLSINTNIDSMIIKQATETKMLSKWISESGRNPKRYELLYRATADGFDSAIFHKKCDGKGPTVTLIQSETGEKFGGYTSLNWTLNGGPYFSDEKSFIFSLDQKEKLPIMNPQHAIYSGTCWGPCFGYSCDITIGNNALTQNSCYTTTGGTYKQLSTGQTLTKDYFFMPKEIEVYAVSDK